MDKLGGPFDLFKEIKINKETGANYTLKESDMKDDSVIQVSLTSQGHYKEN